MRGFIIEWNNGKDYRRGLIVQEKQIKSLLHQGRNLVYLMDDDFNLEKNEKGGNIIYLVDKKISKVIGYQD